MPESRVYVSGGDSSGNAQVAFMDPDTYEVTIVPPPGEAGDLWAIGVVDENDIWVGWEKDTNLTNYPKVAHWDGDSWTVYNIDIVEARWKWYTIAHFHIISSNEIYAVTGYYILKWNGSTWSIHINTNPPQPSNPLIGWPVYVASASSIMPGSTASDMWIGNLTAGNSTVGHWNGADFDELIWFGSGPTYYGTSGLMPYKGNVYVAQRGVQGTPEDAVAKARTGYGTWVTRFTVPDEFQPIQSFSGGNTAWWYDADNDILWCGAFEVIGVNRYGAVKWDGTTKTWYQNTEASTTGPRRLVGITSPGQDAKLFYCGTGQGIMRIRNPDGVWHSKDIVIGSRYYDIGIIQAPTQFPPYIQNQNPAPGSGNNRADGPIYCEVVDDNSDLVASSVRLWVDGVPAWSGSSAENEWTGTRTAVTDGYGYSLTPNMPIQSGATITVRVYALDALGNVLDTTYTFDTGIFLDALTERVSERGGDLILAEGLFPRGEALEVTLDGEACYGGQGKGYSPISDDGTTLEVAAPPLATLGAAKTFEIVAGAGTLQDTIAVVERSWHRAEFESRVLHPPWAALGPRRLDLEPPVE